MASQREKPVNRASRSNCRPIQRILTMTMYTVPPNATVAPAIRRRACFLLKRMGRLLNHWLSAVIAERARQADNIVLRHLSDRELKDIGLTRGDFGEGLAEADRSRIRMQRSKRSKRSNNRRWSASAHIRLLSAKFKALPCCRCQSAFKFCMPNDTQPDIPRPSKFPVATAV